MAAHCLGVTWSELWKRIDEPFDASPLEALVARREDGEPLGYILGSVVFCGIELACGPGVLVPRPETEVVVDEALRMLDGFERPRVVDVGTGSGAIAIAISRARPDADVSGTDISSRALAWARANVARSGTHVDLYEGDLLDPLPSTFRGSIDLIVSNPPYVATADVLPKDVMAEPHLALFAGADGNDLLIRLVEEGTGWLAPTGALVTEIGTGAQADVVAARLEGWSRVRVAHDLNDRPRVVGAKR